MDRQDNTKPSATDKRVAELETQVATLLREHARLRAWAEAHLGPIPEHRGSPRGGSTSAPAAVS